MIYAFLNTVQIQQMFAQSHMCVAEVRPYLEHVVHSSIMKLSENSMDKLFDLITAMVKFQLTCATGPREIMLITLNHLDYVKAMVTSAPELNEFFDLTYKLIINVSLLITLLESLSKIGKLRIIRFFDFLLFLLNMISFKVLV